MPPPPVIIAITSAESSRSVVGTASRVARFGIRDFDFGIAQLLAGPVG